MKPQVGQRIAAPFLSAPGRVKTSEPGAAIYRWEVVLDHDHQTCRAMGVTDDQLPQIKILEGSPMALTGGIDAADCFFVDAPCIQHRASPFWEGEDVFATGCITQEETLRRRTKDG